MPPARLLSLLALTAAGACASQPASPVADSPVAVEGKLGMITRDYTDPERQSWDRTGPRPLRTAIWYPAPASADMTEIVAAGFFVGGAVAPDAPVSAERRRYPLILLSHGTGGSFVQMMWLGRYLAARGFIVAAVNHHGNTGAEPQRRLGAAGFSLGGFTVLLAGGARFGAAQYDAFCASPRRDFTCEPQPEHPTAHSEFAVLRASDPVVIESLRRSDDSYRDPRIRAVFAVAPALGSGLTEDSLRGMRVPVEIVVGAADVTTPPPTNAQRIAALVPRARVTVLPAVTHYTFLDPCTEQGVQVLDLCRDAPTVDRAVVHRRVGEMALRFFRRELR